MCLQYLLIVSMHKVKICTASWSENIVFKLQHALLMTISFYFTIQFFSIKPLPCDPSSLPKYPPSKEFDAKVRDEEARR